MDTRTQASESQHSYPPSPWTASTPTTPSGLTAHTPDASQESAAASAAAASGLPFTPQLEFLPFLFPQQSIYHAQLLHYNKLISPSRGGGLQSAPLPPIVSVPHVQATPRSRSSSKASVRDTSSTKGNTGGGHGNRSHQASDKNRPVITSKEAPPNMPTKQATDLPKNLPHRAIARSSSPQGPSHSSSVPSTPHQHARQFSFESREPSPNANNNHSPRSAYSETNSTLPSLRPLPPRFGGCKYETAQINSRRRIPYSVGNDRLEKLELRNVKSKLSDNEEQKLAADMRQIYEKLLPTDKIEDNRKKLVKKLETIFNDEWPGHDIKVNLFGSSGNLLCSDDSDVDICITTSWPELEGVCMIANLLAKRGMEKVVCISAAKVPIVKIWDPELGLACDMNVNNTLALENTRMVRTYVEADPRVRQLAMIIKYWTRRRIVNDAAFGGTLSSYTWICLIIAFLQLRSPPVVPSLHKSPHKTTKADGTVSDFADNLKKLKGFGGKNKSSEAELLFQFFRFYAHEFDYDKHVLSVRQGKLITKHEKKWHYAINNQLCVEEPFNTSRNLGNTADEYSFHGLHLELRRAFDLISVAKLEEACEQYIFPKEEERVWSRPPPQPRPVLLRSSSQTHSGRGSRSGHRGGRHNNNYHRGGGSNRRASSSVPAYEPNVFVQPVNMQQDMSWFQSPQFPFPYAQQDLMQMAFHQENMRQLHHLYIQSPAFIGHQNLSQQRLSASTGSGQQSADRSRTNSFDNPPVSAPLRPELYALYGMGIGHPFYQPVSTGYGTYPSSPVTTNSGGQEFRRPLQRSSATSDNGIPGSNSSLRSQSQPARSPSAAQARTAYAVGGQSSSSVPGHAPRNGHGIAIPSFLSDDADFGEGLKAPSDSPESEESRSTSFFSTRASSPSRQPQPPQQPSPVTNGIAFGDLAGQSTSPGRRRLSTDQLPQTILDRRMKRASRSPSPLGHNRAFSVGTSSAPLASAPFPGSQKKISTRPLVVNGSGLKPGAVPPTKPQIKNDSLAPELCVMGSIDNALHINTAPPTSNPYSLDSSSAGQASITPLVAATDRPPVLANSSNTSVAPAPALAEDASFRDRIAMMSPYHINSQGLPQEGPYVNGDAKLSPSNKQRTMYRQTHSGIIAPLDLAISDYRVGAFAAEMAHLSPVYEAPTLSPTTAWRKPEPLPVTSGKKGDDGGDSSQAHFSATKTPTIKVEEQSSGNREVQKTSKAQKPATQAQRSGVSHENGHARSAKSENEGGWQKAGKGKKKTQSALGQTAHAEQLPKNESERKGG